MRKLLLSLVLAVGGLSIIPLAQAEYLGLPNGRSADLTQMSDLSVEGGLTTGKLLNEDYDHFGLRVNYRIMPGLILFGDLGKTDVEGFDDTPLGLGAFYQLQNLLSFADSTVKASYHKASLQRTGRPDTDLRILSVEFLISGLDPIGANGMTWYANAGLHRMTGDHLTRAGTEVGIGGGIMLPVGPGVAYIGIDHIDDLTFGGGFRYNIF